jgi:aspartyl protease family protein
MRADLKFVIFFCIVFLCYLSCSKSGRRKISNRDISGVEELPVSNGRTVVKIKKVNGVYEIPTEINGVPMHFIFDTGAGMISISETEAIFLFKQGKLAQEDILGKANFSDANGDISEGTIINLKTVKIGDRILENIQASVVHNLGAPLLMGQSALEKFGKISIDYQQGEITFE